MYVEEMPGCCTMSVLAGFDGVMPDKYKKWSMPAFAESIISDSYDGEDNIAGHVAFSGAHTQRGEFSPFAFAKWLRAQRQRVVETPFKHTTRHGSRIKAFLWTPSNSFRKRLKKSVHAAYTRIERDEAKAAAKGGWSY